MPQERVLYLLQLPKAPCIPIPSFCREDRKEWLSVSGNDNSEVGHSHRTQPKVEVSSQETKQRRRKAKDIPIPLHHVPNAKADKMKLLRSSKTGCYKKSVLLRTKRFELMPPVERRKTPNADQSKAVFSKEECQEVVQATVVHENTQNLVEAPLAIMEKKELDKSSQTTGDEIKAAQPGDHLHAETQVTPKDLHTDDHDTPLSGFQLKANGMTIAARSASENILSVMERVDTTSCSHSCPDNLLSGQFNLHNKAQPSIRPMEVETSSADQRPTETSQDQCIDPTVDVMGSPPKASKTDRSLKRYIRIYREYYGKDAEQSLIEGNVRDGENDNSPDKYREFMHSSLIKKASRNPALESDTNCTEEDGEDNSTARALKYLDKILALTQPE